MVISNKLGDVKPAGDTAVALGFFDGIHLGHQAVINEALAQRENGLLPAVFSFTVKEGAPGAKGGKILIQSENIKEMILENMGVEYLFRPEFSTFSFLSPEEFVKQLLVGHFRAKMVACGADFRFGNKASGDVNTLLKLCETYGIEVKVVGAVDLDGEQVSSTRIRKHLLSGEMLEVARLLGRPYALQAKIIKGNQLGRKLSFPTANQQFPEDQLVPKNGVYATVCHIGGKKYVGATNVGKKPTVEGKEVQAETFLLDFDQDIYGDKVWVEFYDFLRPEKKFDSIEELQAAIDENSRQARNCCQKYL